MSPQANVRGKRSPRGLLEAVAGVGQKRIVHPPKIVTGNGEAIPARPGDFRRILQNVGTNAVFVMVGVTSTDGIPSNAYHYVLAPGVAVDDGYGGSFDFSGTAEQINVYSTTGAHRVAVFCVSDPEAAI